MHPSSQSIPRYWTAYLLVACIITALLGSWARHQINLPPILPGLPLLAVYGSIVFALALAWPAFARRGMPVFLYTAAASFLIPYNAHNTESQILMKILQDQTPALFSGDLAMQSTALTGGYNFFARLYSLFPYEHIEAVFYVSWLLCFASMAMFFYCISRRYLRSRHPHLMTLGMLLFLGLTWRWQKFGGPILGDNDLIYPFYRHQTLAWALGLWALYAQWRGRSIWAGLLLGMAINIHINTGQHLVLWMAADLLCFTSGRLKAFLKTFLAAGLISAGTLWPTLQAVFLAHDATTVPGSFLLISGYLRHPHHLIYSSWPTIMFVQYAVLCTLGIIAWRAHKPNNRHARRQMLLMAVAWLGLLAGYLFVEVIPMNWAAMTQFSRMSIMTKVALGPYIVWATGTLAYKLIPPLCKGFHFTLIPLSRKPVVLGFLTVACLPLLCLRHQTLPAQPTGLDLFLRDHTPPQAIIALPPTYEFGKFGELSRRSALVNVKMFPFTKPYYEDYYRRLMALANLPVSYDKQVIRKLNLNAMNQRYHQLTTQQLRAIARQTPFDYFVHLKKFDQPLGDVSPVYEDARFALYKLP